MENVGFRDGLLKTIAKSRLIGASPKEEREAIVRFLYSKRKKTEITQFTQDFFGASDILNNYADFGYCEWYDEIIAAIAEMLENEECPEWLLRGLAKSKNLSFQQLYESPHFIGRQIIVNGIRAIPDIDTRFKCAVAASLPPSSGAVTIDNIYGDNPYFLPSIINITQDIRGYNSIVFKDIIDVVCKKYKIDTVYIEINFNNYVNEPISEEALPYVLFADKTLYINMGSTPHYENYKGEMYLKQVHIENGVLTLTYGGIKNPENKKSYTIDLAKAVFYSDETNGQIKMCV